MLGAMGIDPLAQRRCYGCRQDFPGDVLRMKHFVADSPRSPGRQTEQMAEFCHDCYPKYGQPVPPVSPVAPDEPEPDPDPQPRPMRPYQAAYLEGVRIRKAMLE